MFTKGGVQFWTPPFLYYAFLCNAKITIFAAQLRITNPKTKFYEKNWNIFDVPNFCGADAFARADHTNQRNSYGCV